MVVSANRRTYGRATLVASDLALAACSSMSVGVGFYGDAY